MGPLDVLLVELDRSAGLELAALKIAAANTHEAGGWNRHSPRFIGQIDGALLENAVDVVAPRVVIEQTIDGQLQFVMKTVDHSAHPTRGRPDAWKENAIVMVPDMSLN